MIEELIFSGSVVYLILASLNDIKHRFVHDYLTYSFGLFFFILRALLYFQTSNVMHLRFILFAVPTFLVSYVLYKTGAWGGGDLKLLTTLSIAVPYFSTHTTRLFFVDFLSNTLITSALFSTGWTMMLMFKNKKSIEKRFNKLDLLIITIPFILGFLFLFKELHWKIFSIFLFLSPILYLSKKFEKELQVVKKPVSELEEGDWILKNIKIGGDVIKKKPTGLTEEDIETLQESRRKSVKVRDGVPFIPGFLLSLIITWLNSNVIIEFAEVMITSI